MIVPEEGSGVALAGHRYWGVGAREMAMMPGGVPAIMPRRVEGSRYGFVFSAELGRARRRGCRAGGCRVTTAGADVQITDLAVDDHACLTFGEPEDLFDLTAAFVRDGLAGGLKVVWVTEAGPQRAVPELARRGILVEPAVASGQMTVADWEGCLLSGQAFSAAEAMRWLRGQMTASQHDGFGGLRVAMDMNWALRPVSGVEQLPEFEEGVAAALAGTTASVLCQYDRERFDPVTLGTVAPPHGRSSTATGCGWPARSPTRPAWNPGCPAAV
jgi:hypothetical protein